MPCYDGGPTEAEIRAEERRKENRAKEAGKAEMTPLLCSACRALERLGFDFDENPVLSQWWDKHKAEDARRQAAEEAQAQRAAYRKKVIEEALQKSISLLSQEEKKILKEEGIL